MGRTIALYQEGFGANGWEYYVHGTEREARVLPTTAQTPGSNTTLTNEVLMQVGLDYATFYVSDHLGNTRVTYTPKGSYYTGFVALSDDFNLTSLDGWAGNESTLSNTSEFLQVDIPAYAVDQYIYKALNEPLIANQGYTFSVTVTGTNIECEIGGATYALANGANTFNFTPTSTIQNPEIRFSMNGGNGQSTASGYKLDKMSLTYDVLYAENQIDYVGDYFPYGKILREFVNADRERYLTTQHERDAETGLDYRGARYYDADIARFLSLDPHAKDYGSLSAYSYVAGNPIIFIDPDGKDIVIPKKEDRVKVQEWINQVAQGYFYVDQYGYLKVGQELENGPAGYSDYYRDKLMEAINDKDVISISIGDTYQENGQTKSVEKDAGGGVTIGTCYVDSNGKKTGRTIGSTGVIISGTYNYSLTDKYGNTINAAPWMILMHEMVGHAIPSTVGSDSGNAVENENKVRRELGPGYNTERTKDPKHNE